jgi:predicted alpha/beta-fold hydrolase
MMLTSVRRGLAVLALAATILSGRAGALDAAGPLPPITLEDVPGFKPFTLKDLPPFGDECEEHCSKSGRVHVNGLLATINYTEFKERKPPVKEEQIGLEPEETGFSKRVDVRLFTQPGKAPLAVTLLGFGQQANDKVSRAWQTYLYNSGCHVLSFDSVVRNNMNEATGHGVAGNFTEETSVIAKIIDVMLERQSKEGGTLKEKTTSVRLLGTSYGGLLSAQLLRIPQAKIWPIDRVLILSTPINMGMAAKRLDTFAREDKPFFGVMQLMKLMGGYTPKNDTPSPKEEALMRAGIGYVFHGDLHAYAKSNIDRYDPELPARLKTYDDRPDQKEMCDEMCRTLKERHKKELSDLEEKKGSMNKDEFEQARKDLEQHQKVQMNVAKCRPSDISNWNFQDYVFLLLKPYWKLKRGADVSVTLPVLLAGAPNFVQAVVAADDPLNDPKELPDIVKQLPPEKLLVIPHGGHLGYSATHWVETLITKFFQPTKAATGEKKGKPVLLTE